MHLINRVILLVIAKFDVIKGSQSIISTGIVNDRSEYSEVIRRIPSGSAQIAESAIGWNCSKGDVKISKTSNFLEILSLAFFKQRQNFP